jgi:hypothetical protein
MDLNTKRNIKLHDYKENTKKSKTPVFCGGGGPGGGEDGQLFADFCFSQGVSEPNPHETRGTTVHEI